MQTRQQVASRILDRGFTEPSELLALTDYEFEQWCGATAKGDISEDEQQWLNENIQLAERWVDGLRGLIESADTQIEHAERDLDEAEDLAEDTGDWSKYDELLEFQKTWKPKIQTFKRKVAKKEREAVRNLKALERASSDRIATLEEAIANHHDAVTMGTDEQADEADAILWRVVGLGA